MGHPKVLVITSTYPRYAGDSVPVFVHELCRRLAATFDMHVLAPHSPGAKTHEVLDGVQVHRFRYLPERFETLAYGGGILPGLRRRPWRAALLPPFLLSEYFAAARLVRSQRISLIHAHWLLPNGLIAARLGAPGRATLCTSHGSDLFSLNNAAFRVMQRYVLKNMDAVTVASRALGDKASAIAGQHESIQVMPMGIDTQRFRPPATDVPRDGLLFVGRLVANKGLDILLRSLASLAVAGLRPPLTVIGAGPEIDGLKTLTMQLGLDSQTTFLGAMSNDDLPRHYQHAAALVFPSLLGRRGEQEGMGLVPVEALACECPVIASDLPGVRDAIQDGQTGLLFPPGDSAALAVQIRQIIVDRALAKRLACRGRQIATIRYDWQTVAAHYAKLYAELIEQSTRSSVGS